MVGGQVLDIEGLSPRSTSGDVNLSSNIAAGSTHDLELKWRKLQQIHAMKTGALIQVSISGTALICGLKPELQILAQQLGGVIGFGFQVADDLEDADSETDGIVHLLGKERAHEVLRETTAKGLTLLKQMNLENSDLKALIQWNEDRVRASHE